MSEPAKASVCRGPNCQRGIWWIERNGKFHPFDDPEGKISHFATCIDAREFSKKKLPAKKDARA